MTASTVMIVAIIAIVAAAIRFYGLREVGLGGNDSILYYSLAEQWLKGNFVFKIGDSVEVFRPTLLAFNAMALTFFGHSDYAIKWALSIRPGQRYGSSRSLGPKQIPL
ncbi:MAG: hypothetical protein V7709_13530 [Halioglobus sp.]